MAKPEPYLSPALSESQVRRLVFVLICLAMIHVFIFAAAFPFFNVADEWAHFDLVIKYSQGRFPRPWERVSAESAPFLVTFDAQESLWPTNNLPATPPPPPPRLTQPSKKAALTVSRREAAWRLVTNYETSQPPLYYLLAGLWWRLSEVCGLHGGSLLYSVRFLNCLFIAALVWLGFLAARLVFPGQLFLQLAVPALVAFMPQTAFYSIQNDILSALCFGVVFVCLIHLMRVDIPTTRLGIITGLALAATYLTNLSNLPLLVLSGGVVLFQTRRWIKSRKWRAALPAIRAMAWCAGLPTVAWLAWCEYAFGNFTGTAEKIQFLGWTYKPFSQWWHHPIFTPHGLWIFISGLMTTFWQGGLLWHNIPLSRPAISTVYTVLSLGLVGVAVITLLPRFSAVSRPQRQVLWLGFVCCLAAIAFLGFLSIIYDFGNCIYPSRAQPYFDSGRLMFGALIPFLLLFAYGLDRALNWTRVRWIKLAVLITMILFMLTSEIAADWPVFSSQYNWFHM